MKIVSETGRVAYKYRVFGWHITISNSPVKFKQTNCGHQSINHGKLLKKRRQIAQSQCERCGRDLTIFGRLYHLLPVGDPGRHELSNLRFVCNSCYKAVTRNSAPFSIDNKMQEGGEA